MNFPLEHGIFRLIYWILNTPGIGGLAALLIGGGIVFSVVSALRWIFVAGTIDDDHIYSFPTSSLLDEE